MGTTIYTGDSFEWVGGAGSAIDPAMWTDLSNPSLTGVAAPDGNATVDFGSGGEVTDDLGAATLTVEGDLTLDGTFNSVGNISNSGTIGLASGDSLGGTSVTNDGAISGDGSLDFTSLANSGQIDAGDLTVGNLLANGNIVTTTLLSVGTTTAELSVTLPSGALDAGVAATVDVLSGSNLSGGVDSAGMVTLESGAIAAGANVDDSGTLLIASGATVTGALTVAGTAMVDGAVASGAGVDAGLLLVESGGRISFDSSSLINFNVGISSPGATVDVQSGQITGFTDLSLADGSTINVDGAGAQFNGGEFDLGFAGSTAPYATINVTDGGSVSSGEVFLSYIGIADSSILVNAGTWTASDLMMLMPNAATASLTVDNGGTVSGTELSLGPKSSALGTGSATVLVAGASSLLRMSGELFVGPSTGSKAVVAVQNNATMSTASGDINAGATVEVMNGGTWTSGDIDDQGTLITDGTIVLANQATQVATAASLIEADDMTVGGTGSTLDVSAMIVGATMPTATNDQSEPDGTAGDWTYVGSVGSLTVADGASVSTGETLTLLAIAEIATDGTETFQGGIDISAGGDLEVGGTAGVAANSLQIDKGGLMVGHGLIDSDVVGTLASTGGPQYALTLDNLGTIEAKDGLLDVHGNITADGTALIDDNAGLEISGTYGSEAVPAGPVDFQEDPAGTLIVDDINNFFGTIENLSENDLSGSLVATTTGASLISAGLVATQAVANAPTLGSAMVLKYANPATNTGVFAATIGTLNGQLDLQLAKGTDLGNVVLPPAISLSGTTSAAITHDFFQVSQSGTNTVLTYTKGNPIDFAVNGPLARSSGRTGQGVRVGVISGNFGSSAAIANDQSLQALPSQVRVLHDAPAGDDEGRAMAQIVHAIAPSASIYFYNSGAFNPSLGATVNSDASVANAITQLLQAGCNVIVDDVSITGASLGPVSLASPEANTDSLTERAIDEAAQLGVTVVTSAGNGSTIFGHALDPFAITVGAMNWLATPTSVGNYLPSVAEPFSAKAPAKSAKPNITGPDGGPTTLPLAANLSPLSPFFGTSAAAPAVAGVAALMVQASHHQLDPTVLAAAMEQTATPTGIPQNQGGAGLVNAQAAVAAAQASVRPLVRNPPTAASSSAFSIATASTGPTVTEADLSQPAGDLNAGGTLQVFVTMSSGVTVSGTPALTLNDGGTASYDAGESDPANGSLVFDYTPGSEATPNLAISGVAANGAIVQDASANPADFSGLFNIGSGLSINSPLQVASVTASPEGEVATGQTVEITLALNNGATVDATGGAPTLALNNGATASYDGALSNPSSGTLVFDYVVGSSDATPDLSAFGVTLPTGTTVQDAAGDNADFTGALNQSLGVQVDPSFVNLFYASQTGAISTGQTLQLSIAMTTPVVIDTAGGAPTLTLNDGAIASYDAAASDAASGTLVFANTVAGGEQVADLEVTAVNLNGATVNDAYGVAVDFSGALNDPTGLTVNSPTAVTSVAASQSGTIGVGQTVTLSLDLNGPASVATIDNPVGPPTLTLNDGGVATYDVAASSATSLAFDYVVQGGDYSPDLMIMSVNANGTPINDALGNNVDFAAATGAATGLAVMACFAAGTRIATDQGEIAVEALRVGDWVRTVLGGGTAPIVWVGQREVDCARHPKPRKVWPVRVAAGAFGPGRPSRDLSLSPDHAVYVNEVLIPVKHLINGSTIVQVQVDHISYYHIELPRHDVVLAQGLPAESFLDMRDGSNYASRPGPTRLYPDFSARMWEAFGCARLVVTGPELDAARALVARFAAVQAAA